MTTLQRHNFLCTLQLITAHSPHSVKNTSLYGPRLGGFLYGTRQPRPCDHWSFTYNSINTVLQCTVIISYFKETCYIALNMNIKQVMLPE